MQRKILLAIAVAGTLGTLGALGSCNSSPTVPVPPPEMCDVTPPDAYGLVDISCERGNTVRDVALVYNSTWGQGVMQETEADGSFTVEIEADSGDAIEVQIKNGDRLSAAVSLSVP